MRVRVHFDLPELALGGVLGRRHGVCGQLATPWARVTTSLGFTIVVALLAAAGLILVFGPRRQAGQPVA